MSRESGTYRPPVQTSSWGIIAATAVATLVVLCLVVPLFYDETSGGYLTGQIFGIVVAASLFGAGIAHAAKGRWPRWVAPVAVVGAAVGLAAMTFVPASLKASADQGTAVRTGQSRSLTAPDELADWHMSSKADQAAYSAGVASMSQSMTDQGDIVGGVYRSGDERMIFVGVNVTHGSGLADDLQEDTKGALVTYIEGVGVEDPTLQDAGDLGGFMACGSLAAQTDSAGAMACTWADDDTVGTVVVVNESPVTASEITRDIRGAATTVSD